MGILEEILSSLPPEPIPIRQVSVGLHWTMVCSRSCGLASSLCDEGPHGHHVVRDVGNLHLKSAQELASWALSGHLLEASLGMAAINSLLDHDLPGAVETNAFDFISRLGEGKNISIIGHFPFTDRLKPIARHLWVIEKKPENGDLPESAAPIYLPWSDVIAITGTALINHTFDQLIQYRPRHAKVVVLGASSPFSPVLFDHGVDFISGSVVVDEKAALLSIQQGATFTHINGVRLVTLEKNPKKS